MFVRAKKRHLVVPSDLAYGDRGAGEVIPPGATLLFDVVIVDVQNVSVSNYKVYTFRTKIFNFSLSLRRKLRMSA